MFSEAFEIISIVAETQSFSKAARLLHLSQPAISSKVQAMEDYYGLKFFNRTAQGVTLTEAGKIIYDYSTKFTDLHSSLKSKLDQLKDTKPQLNIGASCTSGNYALPFCIKSFKDKFPESNIKLDIANTFDTLRKINKGEIDLAVIDGLVEAVDVKVQFLDSISLVFITANNNKLRKSQITLKELKSQRLIVREKGAAMRTVMEKIAADHGCTLDDFNVVVEMNSIHSVKAAVAGSSGVTIVPLVSIKSELESGLLRIIQVEDLDLKIDVNLVYPSNRDLSVITQKFIKFLINPQKPGFAWNKQILI